jgi:glutamine cyclotransferase
MKSNYIRHLLILTIMILLTWTISCSGRSGRSVAEEKKVPVKIDAEAQANLISMKSPEENSEFRLGSPVKVVLETVNKNQSPDSVTVSFDGKKAVTLTGAPWEYTIPGTYSQTTGRKSLKITAYRGGDIRTSVTRFMIILSDIAPKRYGYKIINTYPHDKTAFTQGLFYDNGVLYEGTGQETGSTLREVELTTGKVLRQLNLSPELFGEGITLYKDRIFQVTWTSKVGFIYDKSTFREINKIYYQTQGWGLTTMDDRIVMSDGTDILYFFEPDMFTVVSRLEVYDNEKKVDQLNELEYINGEIWANIWMTDLIARIDPKSGKVLGYIDLKGILNDRDTDTSVDVINGIAWDKAGGRIFVTGKNWPKLFEIRVTE